jgi:hypothetical protein
VTSALRWAALGILSWALVAEPPAAAAKPAAPCTGSVVGRLVLADGTPVGPWIQLTGMPGDPDGQARLTRVAADGRFRVDGVQVGRHNGRAGPARFAFVLGGCGEVVDVGAVEYPIDHPHPRPLRVGRTAPAAEALARFMDARIDRKQLVVLGMLADGFQTSPPGNRAELTQVSNPCWHRYEVISLIRWTARAAGQPAPGSVDALVRVYAHTWSGDNGGLLPFSFAQSVRLVETPGGWRVNRLQLAEYRDEPGEPHGPTTSACNVGRRAAVWPAAALPATGGLPLPALGLLGAALIAAGLATRTSRADG